MNEDLAKNQYSKCEISAESNLDVSHMECAIQFLIAENECLLTIK